MVFREVCFSSPFASLANIDHVHLLPKAGIDSEEASQIAFNVVSNFVVEEGLHDHFKMFYFCSIRIQNFCNCRKTVLCYARFINMCVLL